MGANMTIDLIQAGDARFLKPKMAIFQVSAAKIPSPSIKANGESTLADLFFKISQVENSWH